MPYDTSNVVWYNHGIQHNTLERLSMQHYYVPCKLNPTTVQCALKVDSGRKIPCHVGELNLHRQCSKPSAQPSELHPYPSWFVFNADLAPRHQYHQAHCQS